MALTIMIQGTASDVGKSLLCTALCRIFKQEGLRVAPFKSQNMALNSYVTLDGKEIGRAQGVQAEAAGIPATVQMNPILLKPKAEMTSQVVVLGVPIGDMSAMDYRRDYIPQALEIVRQSLDELCSEFDMVVIEGAGSPAEINLKDRDIANMKVAELADAPVILAADIDRGGVFASIVGTLELLEPHERERIKGFIINKFRGDVRLLQPGLDWLEERTGIPVLGVIPYQHMLYIENEDSVVLDELVKGGKLSTGADIADLDIAVIRLPRISNFTDADPLRFESDVWLRFVEAVSDLGTPDAILLPGTKNTVEDLRWLKETGLADRITQLAKGGTALLGICGGFQMLGRQLLDPDLVESSQPVVAGLGLLDAETVFVKEKRTLQAQGVVAAGDGWSGALEGIPIEGYEIHMGRTTLGGEQPFATVHTARGDVLDGAVDRSGKIIGTYLHGILHNDQFRRSWLNLLRAEKNLPALEVSLSIHSLREAEFDRWAAVVREALNMELLNELIRHNKENAQ